MIFIRTIYPSFYAMMIVSVKEDKMKTFFKILATIWTIGCVVAYTKMILESIPF